MRIRTNAARSIRTLLAVCLAALLSLPILGPGALAEEMEPDFAKVTMGRVSYNLFCKSCHGEWGQGDGPVADLLKLPPADLTCISYRRGGEFPAEDVHKIIEGSDRNLRAHGSEMPFWGTAFMKTEETDDEAVVREKVDQLVHYLRSIQKTCEEKDG